MVYRGTYKNGVIVLQGKVEIAEGQEVTVEPASMTAYGSIEPSEQSSELLKIAGICESGRPDGSVNHDHYIYGTPKREPI